jgi:2-haloacid dehalogenase
MATPCHAAAGQVRARTPRSRGAQRQTTASSLTGLDLTAYKALSFDCYGTLIDWESGIAAVLAPWAREQGLELRDEELLLAYADNEADVERDNPSKLYPDVLALAFHRTGETLGVDVSDAWARRLADSVPDWPAFPDSADALARLAGRYKLIILSNVHRAGFTASNERLRGDFAAIITAEDVGAYKPAENHFRALDATLPRLGLERSGLLHVAQSLFHDHVPAKREGLPSVWINRRHDRPGWGATPEPTDEWSFDLEFTSMGEFAEAVDRAFGEG